MTDLPSQPSLFGDCPPDDEKRRLRLVESRSASMTRQGVGRQLWLAVQLPGLPLECQPGDEASARAVLSDGRQPRVLVCSAAAAAQGVRPGLPANAALALAPSLELLARDTQAEARALEKLAGCSLDFSPVVSLEPPFALLLEIRGSLKLFGGADRLTEQLVLAMRLSGYRAQTGIAPTARAALCLARAGGGRCVESLDALPGALASLPLCCLDWPDKPIQLLAEMGVHRLGGCRRLPRDGLARRLGMARLRELDQVYGRAPEVRERFLPAQHFADELELPALTTDAQLLIEGAEILLQRLGREMRRCQRGVSLLWWRFEHPDQPASWLRLGLLEVTASAPQLLELLRVKLSASRLTAPVLSLALRASLLDLAAMPDGDLLTGGRSSTEHWPAFLARLKTRLGDAAVHGLGLHADHRPELAWQTLSQTAAKPAGATGPPAPRPLWLLPQPRRLRERDGQPYFQGRLQLQAGPERIETGWWDGQDVRRDYFQVSNPAGLRLWVFRDLRSRAWYLQGLFG
jgi:protein ImuB